MIDAGDGRRDGGDPDASPDDGSGPDDGGAAEVTMLAADGSCPEIADGSSGLGIVWRTLPSVTPAGVVFARIDDRGTVVQGPETIVSGVENLDCPAITWRGSEQLVAFSHGSLNRADIDVIAVTESGPGTRVNVVRDSGDSRAPTMQTASTGESLLVWRDQTGTNYHVYAQVDLTGRPVGDEVVTGFASGGVAVASAWTGSDLALAGPTDADEMAVARVASSSSRRTPRVRSS